MRSASPGVVIAVTIGFPLLGKLRAALELHHGYGGAHLLGVAEPVLLFGEFLVLEFHR